MPKKSLASLNVVINAVTTPLFRGLNKASRRLTAFGARMQTIGRSITTSFSLPFAAIAAGGAKMAIDFEKNMSKINTLVGLSAKEVNEFSKDVLKLSGETAQAPAELADGLFFLTSAGLRGANAMETLEAVSKGVAIGLGEQADLAKVAAAAQNAYGEDVISASEALDVFGGAVQQGMFEASDLAEVMGTQLGMASSLGISFQEASAFVATYTKTTGDAKTASTSLGGVMMSLAKTTPIMERALNKVGMTGDSVRASLGEQGLRQTLLDIRDAFDAQGVPLTDFFTKSQALKGVLGVLGNQSETYGDILENLNGSMGMVSDGFDQFSNTSGFKMQQAFNQLKNAAMELGATMMPVFTRIVNAFTNLAKAFTNLDDSQKKLVVAAGALVAFSGPFMTLGGSLMKVMGMVLSPIGLVVAALGALFYVIYKNWGSVKKILVGFINYWIDLYNESGAFRVGVQAVILTFKTLWFAAELTFKNIWVMLKSLATNTIATFSGVGKIIKGALIGGPMGLKDIYDGIIETGDALKNTFDDAIDGAAKNYKAFNEKVAKAAKEGMARGIKDNVALITEKDIDNGVKNIGDWLADKLGAVKSKLTGFMGGAVLELDETEVKEVEETIESQVDIVEDTIQKKKTLWQQYWQWAQTGYAGFATKVGEAFNEIASHAGSVINAIGGLWAAEHEKEMTILNNERTAETEKFDEDYEREKQAIENSTKSQEEKDALMLALDQKFNDRKTAMDKKFDDKEKALQQKKARRDKAMKIAQAIMSTAQAVVQALTAGPILGPILATLIGALGAAQIAMIASTPLPMAKGGIAFGPTNALVGEYAGARTNPEVVAPLDKLRSMLNPGNVALNVAGIVKGEDIYLSNSDTSNGRPRYI